MPAPPQAAHPSQQVERIREILVGRQMRAVEQRLERIESRLRPMPVESAENAWARDLEALRRDASQSARHLRDALEAEHLRRQEETERLARRIEAVSRSRCEPLDETRRAVVADLRAGFDRWRDQLFDQLRARESQLVAQFREELDRMRAWRREEMSGRPEADLHQAFDQLADAARRIADKLPSRS